jgi:hypothetical protein
MYCSAKNGYLSWGYVADVFAVSVPIFLVVLTWRETRVLEGVRNTGFYYWNR